MFSGMAHLTGIALWARGSGLEIVLLVTGAILLTRLVTWLGARITDRIDANAQETDALVRSEASKHRHALAQVITWATLVVIYCATAVAIVARFGIPVTSLVAPAAVAQASALRELMYTRAPASSRPRAIMSPIPRLPPVTTAVFPDRSNKSMISPMPERQQGLTPPLAESVRDPRRPHPRGSPFLAGSSQAIAGIAKYVSVQLRVCGGLSQAGPLVRYGVVAGSHCSHVPCGSVIARGVWPSRARTNGAPW